MGGDPDPAAHHDAVHHRDIGLGVAGDPGVEAVLVAPELLDLARVAAGRGPVDGDDVAAGAEGPLSGPGDDDGRDPSVLLPVVQGRRDPPHHPVGEGVEGGGPVEDDQPRPPLALDQDLLGPVRVPAPGPVRAPVRVRVLVPVPVPGHQAAPVRPRATMTRMISLVPSRIWCTRRSRTIFSMPYSAR